MAFKKEDFYKQTPETRIGAVISDGQWYTRKKWSNVARVKLSILNEWINDNIDTLVISETDSIRRPGKYCLDWYQKNNIDIKEEIIPNNYPIRIFDGKTETEHFESNPSIYLSTITIMINEDYLDSKIIDIVKGCGYITRDENKILVSCLEPSYVINRIKMFLTDEEETKVTFFTRQGYRRRDISRFSPEFLMYMYEFYLPYSFSILKGHQQTLSMFISNQDDLEMQILEWLYEAMEKFDETNSTPFAGYLATVLRYWPYNLPDNSMGKELAQFQRNKRKLIEELDHQGIEYTDEMLAEKLNMDIQDYHRLSLSFMNWEGLMNPTETTENCTNYKHKETNNTNDKVISSKISRTVLEILLKDKSYTDNCRILLQSLERGDGLELVVKLDQEFKDLFMEVYEEIS